VLTIDLKLKLVYHETRKLNSQSNKNIIETTEYKLLSIQPTIVICLTLIHSLTIDVYLLRFFFVIKYLKMLESNK